MQTLFFFSLTDIIAKRLVMDFSFWIWILIRETCNYRGGIVYNYYFFQIFSQCDQTSTMPRMATECCLGQKEKCKCKMCTNFANLNKCHPKNDFPIPKIDTSVDFTASCGMLYKIVAYDWLYKGCSCLSLYSPDDRHIDLVLVGYDRRVLIVVLWTDKWIYTCIALL
jgi:hypothetical protein